MTKAIEQEIIISNEWMKSDKSKVCKCSNCGSFAYVNWLFEHMKFCMESCPNCGKYSKFKILNPSK